MPDYSRELALGAPNRRVAGLDEVGRGPLAGPVVAAAAVFLAPPQHALAAFLDDSKKLTVRRREAAFALLLDAPDVEITLGAASVEEIERLNIGRATLLAMSRALGRLRQCPDVALVDGNRAPDLPCRVETIIGGDGLSLSIAAASIVAKVVRDRAMARLARRYRAYGWEKNAGYGTATHMAAVKTSGVTAHHRRGFAPIRAQLALSPAGAEPEAMKL